MKLRLVAGLLFCGLCQSAVADFKIFAEWNYKGEPTEACLQKIGFTFNPKHRFTATFELFDQTPASTYAEPGDQAWYTELVNGWFGLGTPPSNSSAGTFDILILDNEPSPAEPNEDNWKISNYSEPDAEARSEHRDRWLTKLNRIQTALANAGEADTLVGYYNLWALPDGGHAELNASIISGTDLTEWQANNDDLNSAPQYLIDAQEVTFPSIYLLSTYTLAQWNNRVDNILTENRRMYGADTPIYAVMWPAYADTPAVEIDGTTWRAMLDKVYTHYQAGDIDGIVMWAGISAQNGLYWSFGKDWWRATSAFMAENKIGAGGTCLAAHGYSLRSFRRLNKRN